MVHKRWAAVICTAAACALGVLVPGLSIHAATDPKDVLRTAVDSTRQVSSIHAEGHTTGSTPAPSGTEVRWTASLAGTNSDVTINTPKTTSRTVAVGDKVYQQAPVTQGSSWQVMDRAPVASDTTPGTGLLALVFPDGRSAGDPSLYRRVSSASSTPAAAPTIQVHATASADTIPPAQQTLVAELDMPQVGQALRVGPSDQALLGQWRGSLTLTLTPDGRIARQVLTLNGPSPAAGLPAFSMTHEVSYSQFNTTTVAAPVRP